LFLFQKLRSVLPAKGELSMMTKMRRRTSPEGSASSEVPAITLPLILLGEGAQGPSLPLVNLLPKIRMTRMTTLTLIVRGKGKGLSVISSWQRAAREVCPCPNGDKMSPYVAL
jgi:hypothetical protein